MSYPVLMPAAPMPVEVQIEKIQRGISDTSALCASLGDFLAEAFPNAASQAHNFAHWLDQYLNHNNIEYLEQLRKPAGTMPAGFGPFDPAEHLVQLCKRRDAVQEQVDAFEAMIEQVEEKAGADDPMVAMFRMQLKASGIPQQLEDLNEQISNFQRQMEAQAG